MRASLRRRFETLEPRRLLTCADVCISEFLASNQDGIRDAFGSASDWIEIYNPTDAAIDLNGWHLTDDPDETFQWTFEQATPLASQARLIVWASGQDVTDDDGNPHTNFKLSAGGEFVGLARPDGTVVSSYGADFGEYPVQSEDVSYGIDQNGEERYFLTPTPLEANGVGFLAVVADTKFSVDRGFYSDPFTLTISSSTPLATLVYTLDGSPPSPDNGTQVEGNSQLTAHTLTIDGTTTVRAMVYRDGWESTNIDTQTYVFPDQVIQQTGEGLPDTWGHAGADYEMDPEIVSHSTYQDEIVDGLKSIPTLSLVTDLDHWFDRRTGIYPEGSGEAVPVSAELIFADGTEGFQVDGSVEIQGGSSTNRWKSDKLSMQLKFKRELGDAKLEYPLFGDEATDEFDTLVVDARLNQAWHYGGRSSPINQRTRAQYTRDQFVADLQNTLGGQAPRGRWVHVYLNGIYWGIHNLHERPDEHFASEYLGGDDDDYDIIKHNSTVIHGGFSNYRDLLSAVNEDTRQDSQYELIEQMLDIDQFINYMQVNYFVGNTDWAHHNWYASYNKVSGEGKWRFHSWDAEHVLKGLNDDATGRDDALGPTHIHVRLMRNGEYRLKFMDAVQRNFYNDGLFTFGRATELYQHRLDEVYEALVPESARWGDNQRSRPFTRDNEWVAERDRLLNDYFPQRTAVVIQQLRDRNFFHDFDAPRFNVHGGDVEPGFGVAIRGTGELFYTTDGSDPATSDSKVRYTGPVPVGTQTTIRVRSLNGNEWSAIVEATFTSAPPTLAGDFSHDGVLDAKDLDLLAAAIRNETSNEVFDVTGDAQIDELDMDHWIVEIAQTRRGDANLDGNVDFADFLIVSANFGKVDRSWGEGDLNGDGEVSFEDFLLLSGNFGWGV